MVHSVARYICLLVPFIPLARSVHGLAHSLRSLAYETVENNMYSGCEHVLQEGTRFRRSIETRPESAAKDHPAGQRNSAPLSTRKRLGSHVETLLKICDVIKTDFMM